MAAATPQVPHTFKLVLVGDGGTGKVCRMIATVSTMYLVLRLPGYLELKENIFFRDAKDHFNTISCITS